MNTHFVQRIFVKVEIADKQTKLVTCVMRLQRTATYLEQSLMRQQRPCIDPNNESQIKLRVVQGKSAKPAGVSATERDGADVIDVIDDADDTARARMVEAALQAVQKDAENEEDGFDTRREEEGGGAGGGDDDDGDVTRPDVHREWEEDDDEYDEHEREQEREQEHEQEREREKDEEDQQPVRKPVAWTIGFDEGDTAFVPEGRAKNA